MGRILYLLCFLALAKADNDFFKARICPDGYHYAGEDTKKADNGTLKGVAWEEVINRSPVYSCYKISELDQAWANSNDSEVPYQMTFNAAVDACAEDKGKPVALEDFEEVDRLAKLLHDTGYTNDATFLTSAVFFTDKKQWMWLGSNVTLNTTEYGIDDGNASNQCLAFNIQSANNGTDFSMTETLKTFNPVGCIKRGDLTPRLLGGRIHQSLMVCEVRAQTVTYLAWFYSNWLAFLLILMTFLLLTALCLSVFKYKGPRTAYANRRVYRAEARATQEPTRDLPYGDEPPTYSDVTGIVTETQQTKMDKYKNKGKEILAKVTLYKNTTN